MGAMLLLLTTVAAVPPFDQLAGLDQQIEAVDQQIDQARARSLSAQLKELRQRRDLLQRARGRAITIIGARYDQCLAHLQRSRAGAANESSDARAEQIRRAQCAAAGREVVTKVLRIEELKQQLHDTQWTYGTLERKRELEREIQRLEESL